MPAAAAEPVARTGLRGDGVAYEISFSVSSTEKLGAIRSEVFGQIQHHLRHAGIPLAVAGLASVPPLERPTPADLLAQSDLFGSIEAGERDLLARGMAQVHLKVGETPIRQGDEPRALFVIASGTVEISRRAEGARRMSCIEWARAGAWAPSG